MLLLEGVLDNAFHLTLEEADQLPLGNAGLLGEFARLLAETRTHLTPVGHLAPDDLIDEDQRDLFLFHGNLHNESATSS